MPKIGGVTCSKFLALHQHTQIRRIGPKRFIRPMRPECPPATCKALGTKLKSSHDPERVRETVLCVCACAYVCVGGFFASANIFLLEHIYTVSPPMSHLPSFNTSNFFTFIHEFQHFLVNTIANPPLHLTKAILFIHDLFGYSVRSIRLLSGNLNLRRCYIQKFAILCRILKSQPFLQ